MNLKQPSPGLTGLVCSLWGPSVDLSQTSLSLGSVFCRWLGENLTLSATEDSVLFYRGYSSVSGLCVSVKHDGVWEEMCESENVGQKRERNICCSRSSRGSWPDDTCSTRSRQTLTKLETAEASSDVWCHFVSFTVWSKRLRHIKDKQTLTDFRNSVSWVWFTF